MTKARARERAKSRALNKTKKRKDTAEQSAPSIPSGQFDPGAGSIKGMNVNSTNSGSARRGAARSK